MLSFYKKSCSEVWFATLLTTLCFIDGDMNGKFGNLVHDYIGRNFALSQLKRAKRNDQVDWIERGAPISGVCIFYLIR